MTTKKYYWLKLPDNFFEDKSIKKLRRIAGGDTYTIIYLKMLLKSLKDNGKIYYDGIEESVAEEIALELDEDADNVLVTINFLKRYGLLKESGDDVMLTQIPTMVGSESAAAERMRRSREKKKVESIESDGSQPDAIECNDVAKKRNNVTPELHHGYVEIEKEIEKSKEIEVEIDTEKRERDRVDITVSKDTVCPTDVERVMSEWNALGINSLKYIKPGTNRQALLKARINEYGIDSVLEAISNIKRSSFLRGQNQRGWLITFDWFIKPNNFLKVLEGNYDDKSAGPPGSQQDRNSWIDNIDYTGIEEGI